MNEKATRNETILQDSHLGPCKVLGIIFDIPETTETDCMYQKKKEGEDLPAFKIGLIHRYNNSKTTYTSAEED